MNQHRFSRSEERKIAAWFIACFSILVLSTTNIMALAILSLAIAVAMLIVITQ